MKKNYIIEGECVEVMQTSIGENTIPLVFADPPYNLSGKSLNLENNTTGGPFFKVNEEWDVYDEKEYNAFTAQWMKACHRVLTPNGSIYISCTQHNVGEILMNAKSIGYKLNNILTWYKINAMPNITKRTFTHSTEYVVWFVKGKNWVFNYDEVKQFNPNKTKEGANKQMRDFLDFIELPIVQGKERIHLESGRAAHPTQKPEKLLELIILASSNAGDLVLDPFFGSGTTGVVAQGLGRNWIGIERNANYCRIAEKRLQVSEITST